VNKKGKMDKTEIAPQIVVDCVMYVLELAVKEMVERDAKDNTHEALASQAPTDNGSSPAPSGSVGGN